MGKESTPRKEYIDICRGIATICVIVIHVSSNNWYGFIGSRDWITFTVYEGLSRIAVPVFFMISGCLFLNSVKDKPLLDLYKNSIGRLVFFLLFWAYVYKIIGFLDNDLPFILNLKKVTLEILKRNTQAHLWFIYSIIICYIFVPILRPVVRNSSKNNLFYAIVVCICMGCIWNQQIGYIGYFLLGAYIDRYAPFSKFEKKLYVFGVVASVSTVGLVLLDCISTQSLNERYWSYTMPYMYISSAALFMYIKNCNINRHIKNMLVKISYKSLGIYGVHFVFIIVMWKVGLSTFLFAGILSVPVISLIVLVLSYYSSSLLQKVPIIGQWIA